MTEPLDLFADFAAPSHEATTVEPMTPEQRAEIRARFATLQMSTAREQFDLVNVLIGVRLQSVAELNSKSAALLISRLRERVKSHSKISTGNAWDDREEDTWIDNL